MTALIDNQDAVPLFEFGGLPGPVIAVARPAVQHEDRPALPGVGVEEAIAVGHLVVGHVPSVWLTRSLSRVHYESYAWPCARREPDH